MEELALVPQKSPALHMVNTPVGSRKPAKDSSLAIVDLKRKIAELEHQEEERELRKLRLSDQTNVSCAAKGAMTPQHHSTPQGAPRAGSIAQKSRNGKFARKAKAREDYNSPQMPLAKTSEGKGRYYAGVAPKVQRRSSVSLTIIAEDDDDSSESSRHTEDAQGAWNRKESVSNPAQSIADKTQDGLIDDLRSEQHPMISR